MIVRLSPEVRAASPLALHFAPKIQGRVVGLCGPLIRAIVPCAAYGQVFAITRENSTPLLAQVVSFSNDEVQLAPLDVPWEIGPGSIVTRAHERFTLSLPAEPLGSIVDVLGKPLNTQLSQSSLTLPFHALPPAPLSRPPVRELFHSGIKSIDTFCSVGYGQRVGIFAGPGSGKSTLLGMIARHADVDVSVIGLVGERGREVNEFVQDSLGEVGLSRAVVVVATSDESPLRRSLAPLAATAIAEHFRNQGKRVLLLIDSLTRTARALREVSLAAGELPVRQGYTSTVFSELPRIVERAGTSEKGSITAFYTVLTQEGDIQDPLADELRSLLDGHLVLSDQIALDGIRPAIDLTRSVSRLFSKLRPHAECLEIQAGLGIISKLAREREMLLLGGTPDTSLSAALRLEPELKQLLNQAPHERHPLNSGFLKVRELNHRFRQMIEPRGNREQKKGLTDESQRITQKPIGGA